MALQVWWLTDITHMTMVSRNYELARAYWTYFYIILNILR